MSNGLPINDESPSGAPNFSRHSYSHTGIWHCIQLAFLPSFLGVVVIFGSAYAFSSTGEKLPISTRPVGSWAKNDFNSFFPKLTDGFRDWDHCDLGGRSPNLSWDGNGQLTDWGTTGYTWTALGQMSQASVSGETARDYTYDAFGRRVKTVVGAVETEMLYHGWHMIGAFEKKVGGNEWLWQEVPMSSGEGMIEHVALDTNDMDEDLDTSEYLSYAVHEDWQNTVWALSNTSAVVVERYEQDDPFGKSHTLDASGNNLGNFASKVYHHKRMHGGVVEPVTGLYDFRNRWYSPESGSWLSRDPLGYVDSENLYQGFGGDPIRTIDPFGLCYYPGPPSGFGVSCDLTSGPTETWKRMPGSRICNATRGTTSLFMNICFIHSPDGGFGGNGSYSGPLVGGGAGLGGLGSSSGGFGLTAGIDFASGPAVFGPTFTFPLSPGGGPAPDLECDNYEIPPGKCLVFEMKTQCCDWYCHNRVTNVRDGGGLAWGSDYKVTTCIQDASEFPRPVLVDR